MKKVFSIVLALVMALSVFSVIVLAETPDFTYEIVSEEDETCKVTGAKAGTVDLVIPAEIDGYKVVAIENRAFQKNTEIASVQLPDTLERIGQSAFAGTAFYKNNANWADGVLYIGNFVVAAKTTIEGEYKIKDGTTLMADSAFRNCKKLTKVTFPDGMIAISLLAFRDCETLAEVVFPSSLKAIGSYAFTGCVALKSVTLPNGIETIDSYAFNGTGLTEIAIPANVKTIGDYAFCRCADLVGINVAEGNENYASVSGVLYNKEMTTIIYVPYKVDYSKVEFPDSVTTIGACAFEGATFETIEIPANITTIEKSAFANCENLKKVKISENVTEIGENAFAGCHEEFYIDAPVGSYAYTYAQENDLLPGAIPGDVNGDGKVGVLDARWILQYVASNRSFTAKQVELADLNGDGKVSAIDARMALQLAAKVN